MNIQYTEKQIDLLKAKESEIHEQTIVARNASDRALKLMQELNALHTQIAIEFFRDLEAKQK